MGREQDAFILGAEPLPGELLEGGEEGSGEGKRPSPAPKVRSRCGGVWAAALSWRALLGGSVFAALAALGALLFARVGGEEVPSVERLTPSAPLRAAVFAPFSGRPREAEQEARSRRAPEDKEAPRPPKRASECPKPRIEVPTPKPLSEPAPVSARVPLSEAPADPAPVSRPEQAAQPAPSPPSVSVGAQGERAEFSFER